jgi:hypothetical protein
MKLFGLQVAVVAMTLAVPAMAQAPAAQRPAPTPGFFDRILSVFDGSQATPDAGNAPTDSHPKSENGDTTGGQAPLNDSGADTSDQDSYKPDAGDPKQ